MKKILKLLPSTLLTTLMFITNTPVALAQAAIPIPGGNGGPTGLTNPAIGELGADPSAAAEGTIFVTYFISLWRAAINVGALLVIVYFIWGAIDWIGAGGDKSKVESARNKITYAIIGLVLLVASFAIIGFISMVFFGESFNILAPEFLRPDDLPGGPPAAAPAAQ